MRVARPLPLAVGLVLCAAAALAACPPQNTPQPVPPAPESGPGYQPPDQPPPPPPPPSQAPPDARDLDKPLLGAVGDPCETGADCDSGLCEGQGCGPRQGVCAARDRACTKDLVAYCGCDGRTFSSSGACPGQRFVFKGDCQAKRAEGAPCAESAQCASGVCEGQGCGADALGVCAPARRACTKDRRPYCGCDGKTFYSSGSCPGRRFTAPGECPK